MGKIQGIAIPHIQEARRYLDNAKQILSEKAGKRDRKSTRLNSSHVD